MIIEVQWSFFLWWRRRVTFWCDNKICKHWISRVEWGDL